MRTAAKYLIATALVASLAAGLWNKVDHLQALCLWLGALACAYAGGLVSDRGRSKTSWTIREPLGFAISEQAEAIGLMALLTAAIIFRFAYLVDFPRTVIGDEAMYVDAKPGFPNPFAVGWLGFASSEAILHRLPTYVFGMSHWSLRFGSAILGVLSILAVYGFVRRWWGPLVGLVAGATLVCMPEHIFWSRVALNNLDVVLVGALTCWAAARVLDGSRHRDAVLLGITVGLGWHVFHAAKEHGPIVAVWGATIFVARPSWRRCILILAGLVVVGAAVTILPLVPDIIENGEGWLRDHSRLDVQWRWAFFLQRARQVNLLMFNRSFTSVFTWGAWWPFWAGVAIAVYRIRDPRHLLLLVWTSMVMVAVGLNQGVMTNFVSQLPVVCVFPALAVGEAMRWCKGSRPAQLIALVAVFAWLDLLGYQAWARLMMSADVRDARSELCRLLISIPTPLTVYIDGDSPGALYLRPCALASDPQRRIEPFSRSVALPTAGTSLVIVFPDRAEDRSWLRERYPESVESPAWSEAGFTPLFTVVWIRWQHGYNP